LCISKKNINIQEYKRFMLYLLVFGNPYLKEDNLAILVADSILKDRIKDIEIVKCISPDEVMNYTGKDFVILDVVSGIKDVMIIDDIDKLKSDSPVSMHDFDLGFFLKLMKETDHLKSVKIIGIPQKGNMKEIKEKVLVLLKK